METIRQARIEDAERIAAAERATVSAEEGLLAARPHEVSVEGHRRRIERAETEGLYIVAEADGDLRGHLILEPIGYESLAHVVQLTIVVHPGCRGQGLGRRLMNHAITWGRRSERIERIELRVRSTNPRAVRLYESLGFEHEGRMRNRIRLSDRYADDLCMALWVGSGPDDGPTHSD